MKNEDEIFYKDFGLTKLPSDYLNLQELYNLFKKPTKEKRREIPRFYNFEEDHTHQCDLLLLPEDKGYKYLLVVVDIATNTTDAQPLKNKAAEDVLEAIKTIYNRGILSEPKKLIVDSGSEFKGAFQKYFKDKEIFVKKALTARHRQVGMVERKNQIIARVIFMKQTAIELLTGQENKEWVDDIEFIIKKLNEKQSREPLSEEELLKEFNPYEKLKQEILPIGTVVRVKLDYPQRATDDKRLYGDFRESDIRFSKEKYKIINFILDPINPLMYEINKPLKNNEKVAYTRSQLQIVKPDEKEIRGDILLKNKSDRTYIVKEILDKRKYKNKIQYLVRWYGYGKDKATWEYKHSLPKQVIDEYENMK